MELAIGQLIKILLGIIVVAAVIFGLYHFSTQVNDFFGGLNHTENPIDNKSTNVKPVLDCTKCGGSWFDNDRCVESTCKSISPTCRFSKYWVISDGKCIN